MATPKETKAPAAPVAVVAKPVKVPMTPEQKAAAKAARESSSQNDRFTRVIGGDKKGVAPNAKIPPQAQVILNVLETAGAKGMTRKELTDSLKGVLVTRQPEGRILSYYQKLIVETGAATYHQYVPVEKAA